MYTTILFLHATFRWLVLLFLFYAISRAYKGYRLKTDFLNWDDKVRNWTATIAHIQLILGALVYIKSPLIQYYFSDFKKLILNWNLTFFGLFHVLLMLIALVVITIGSAKAKRKKKAIEKHRSILIWFSIALFIIFIAIPWPFSPFTNRPYVRML